MKKSKIIDFIKSPIGIILSVGLILRILLFFMYQPYNNIDEVMRGDAKEYHLIAVSLIEKGQFFVENSTIDTFRTPAYPIFLAIIYLIFGINVNAVIAVQLIIALGSVFLIYKIAYRLFNKRVAILSAAILSIEPNHILISYDLLTEILFIFILLAGTLCLIRSIQENSYKFLIFSAFLVGLTSLIRPISLFIPIIPIFIITIKSISDKENWNIILKKSSLFVIIFIITIAPWFIRNKIVYDSFSFTSISGFNLLNYNVAYTINANEDKPLVKIREELYKNKVLPMGDSIKMEQNRFYLSEIQKKVAMDYIKNHKWNYFKAHIIGMINLYSVCSYKTFILHFFKVKRPVISEIDTKERGKVLLSLERLRGYSIYTIIFGLIYFFLFIVVMYILVAIGIWELVKEKRFVLILSLLSVIMYFTVLTGVVGGVERYKMPISAYYILFASYGVNMLINKLKKQNTNNTSFN